MVKDLTQVQKKYKGLWVAFADDEETVVGSGDSLKEGLDDAKHNGYNDPIMSRMPQEIAPYVG